MRHNKRFLALLLAVIMLLCWMPGVGIRANAALVASGTANVTTTWMLDSFGTLSIAAGGPTANFDKGEAPWYSYRSQITSLEIGSGATIIGMNSFYNLTGLTTVDIPDTVQGIGGGAFEACTGLTSVTIGKQVNSIGVKAFAACSNLTGIWVSEKNAHHSNDSRGVLFDADKLILEQAPGAITDDYTIPDGTMIIGEAAFYDCDRLTSVTIPESVTAIGKAAFSDCAALSDVYYAGTAEQWEQISVRSNNESLSGAALHLLGQADTDQGCLADAVENTTEGDTLTLQQDAAEDVTVSKNICIDLNGFDITGTVTVVDGCCLSVMDRQTDDYAVEDGNGYGKIAAFTGNIQPQSGYMMVTEADGISFHRVDMAVTSMTLRPECAGVYYTGSFFADEVAAQNIDQFGIALRIEQAPDACYMKTSSAYSRYNDFVAGEQGSTATGTLLKNVMQTGNAAAVNEQQSKLKIWGCPYILTDDGQYLFGETVSRSLMDQVQAADAMWKTLTAAQKSAVKTMYNAYSGVMENWYLPNMNNTDIDVPF